MLAWKHRLIEKLDIPCRSSNKQRLAFAHTIVDEIMDSAEQPLNGRGWWMQEDDPWQVLACCMEIANALKSPDHRNYVSYFPVHQDGSCNGLQHYAALGRDCLGADCVNLTPRENPQVRKGRGERIQGVLLPNTSTQEFLKVLSLGLTHSLLYINDLISCCDPLGERICN